MKKNIYKEEQTAKYFIQFYIVFCTRFRRRIFDFPRVTDLFRNHIYSFEKELDIEIVTLECNSDHVYLVVNSNPNLSPASMIYRLKRNCTFLADEIAELSAIQNVWTRNVFISTKPISKDEIAAYVESQPKRYVKKSNVKKGE